ncbi:hypothetical protein RGUI_1888 [Rhodovulum sp. P5]|uniref:VPLPA-CTERM sorting domain-containing protein n=1 Tax=Rhodovulum sp. P5 TaxID=1564506 RepID=UPI0009C3040D|nr:VPLPA-CTERM sorting domain-containing protein [Rhodovulum sp. P5]ARE40029.1 hypothetical protein RGUI_1888 [Rhodovulum sp. P5]
MRILPALILAAALPATADAATVASGATLRDDAGGINVTGTAVSIYANYATYWQGTTTPESEWVWEGDAYSVDEVDFSFEFDLTGYDVSTASLAGLIGVDNTVTVYLNGNEFFSHSGFTSLVSYGTAEASYFLPGLNVLSYEAVDLGGPGSFRATVTVTADVAATPAVPLPAGAPLMIGAFALLGALGMRAKRG